MEASSSHPQAAPTVELPFELTSLEHAHRYSNWIYSSVAPHLGRRILELGAGIGNLSQWLPRRDLLVITEADDDLYQRLQKRFPEADGRQTMIKKIDLSQAFGPQVQEYALDTIVSFNVMEHIEDDEAALREQIQILRDSPATGAKRLVVFVPAHQFAYGSFDRVFKHYRRYSAKGLRTMFRKIDPQLRVSVSYFNLLSLPGWIWFGRVRKSTQFDLGQIALLEKIIPFWRPIDAFLHRVLRLPLGQSVVAVVEVR